MMSGKGGLRECQAMAVMRSPVVSRDKVLRRIKWRLSYMYESISTREKASTDQAVHVQERKQR